VATVGSAEPSRDKRCGMLTWRGLPVEGAHICTLSIEGAVDHVTFYGDFDARTLQSAGRVFAEARAAAGLSDSSGELVVTRRGDAWVVAWRMRDDWGQHYVEAHSPGASHAAGDDARE